MFESISHAMKRQFRAFMLRTSGWKQRKCLYYRKPVIQWQDPDSGLWYFEDVAMQMLTVNARDQIDRR